MLFLKISYDLRLERGNVSFLGRRLTGTLIQVSIIESKTILFIKAPSHNLRPIEHFLQKRDFKVFIELDVKMAVVKIIELQPSIIFLAWDHPNSKIFELPNLIAQTSQATVVPYIMGYAKEDVRRLDLCAINPKLYPPISGPAIERLITKFIKVSIRKNSDYDEIVSKYKSGKETVSPPVAATPQLQPAVVTEKNVVETVTASFILENKKPPKQNFILIQQQKRSEILLQYKRKSLPTDIATELKKTLPVKIKIPIEKLLKTLNESSTNSENLIIDSQHGQTPGPKGPKTYIPSAPAEAPTSEKNILQNQNANIQTKNFQVEPNKYKAYCLSIFSDQWCGYLTIVSNKSLDFSRLNIISSEWINEHFKNLLDIDEHDFVELNDIEPNLVDHLSENADYFEKIEIENYDISVSFLSVDPVKMNLELNEENTLIKISTQDVPSDKELNFSLHLHLPENKKYIVYTQANKKLSLEQKNRLLTNKIMQLYMPFDFESEYKKFITEKNIKDFCLNPVKKKSAV